jgi:hypothetical protein
VSPAGALKRCIVPALLAGAALALASGPGAAQSPTFAVVTDEFTGDQISPERWLPCRRDENDFRIVRVPERDFNAVEAVLRPRQDLSMVALLMRHPGCRNDGMAYRPEEGDERAELWEADAIRLPFGTEVWYRFAMFVDPAVPRSVGRFVIGQWKQSNSATGDSPLLAQRFNGRVFSITVEQDNRDPDRHPEDTQCRIFVAADRNGVTRLDTSEGHSLLPAPRASSPTGLADLPSVAHDETGVAHGPTERVGGVELPKPCRRDVKVETFAHLPDAFGHWVTMLYHLHLNGGSSLIEIWAEGQPIARVSGRIGFEPRGPGKQYFKFGPYRNHESFTTFAQLAHYARGFRREDVER